MSNNLKGKPHMVRVAIATGTAVLIVIALLVWVAASGTDDTTLSRGILGGTGLAVLTSAYVLWELVRAYRAGELAELFEPRR